MSFTGLQFGRLRFRPALWPTVAFLLLLPLLLGLGLWQLDRAGVKQSLVEQRAAGEVSPPLDLSLTIGLDTADRYRPAMVRGRYDASQQWLLDNRVFRGQPGYHVFTPFVAQGGERPTLLVNRGWVAVGETREYLPRLPVPEGDVELSGHLDSPASVGLVLGEPPLHSVEDRVAVLSLDIAALSAARGIDLLPYALVLDENRPGSLQYDWSPVPEMGPEKHLGYAVQWFGLAVALVIIFVGVNIRRDDDNGEKHVRV
ncbi:MAG: SURF1 family protein [Gammaproteobacteria bacterium]|nr:SURF1 family protein [Gammaproteobacteria bacterium]